MTATAFDRIETSGGISVPNFFNGRILGAKDLEDLLTADREHRALLGRAVGAGVAAGLRVTRSSAGVLGVTAGVAVNAHGETIVLPGGVDVGVSGTASQQSGPVPAGGVFVDGETTSGGEVATNAFVLTVRPDSMLSGSAPADPYLTGEPCGPGYVVEGVRFRRVPIATTALAAGLGVNESTNLSVASDRARNVLSHFFLGSPGWLDHAIVPFLEAPDLEAAQAAIGLDDGEVPLALFHLQGADIGLVDEWSVRRPCRPPLEDDPLAGFISKVRAAAGMASYLQFQAQLGADAARMPVTVGTARVAGTARAMTDYRYLPGAGILPAPAIGSPATVAAFIASTSLPFFADLSNSYWAVADRPVASARVEEIVRDGARVGPVDIPSGRGLPLQVVAVKEAVDAGAPYAVFVADHHPYRDRIRLHALEDEVATLEPPEDVSGVTVIKMSHEWYYIEPGYRIVARYKVISRTVEEYRYTTIQEKLKASLPYPVSGAIDGPTQQYVAGEEIVTVHYTVLLGNWGIGYPIAFATFGTGEPGESEAAAPAEAPGGIRYARTVAPGRARVGAVGSGRAIGDAELDFPTELYLADFRFGLDAESVADSSISDRATFAWELP